LGNFANEGERETLLAENGERTWPRRYSSDVPSEVREEYANEARRRVMSISETSVEHDARAKQPTFVRENLIGAHLPNIFGSRACNFLEDPVALTSRSQIKSVPSLENGSERQLRRSHNSSTLGRNC